MNRRFQFFTGCPVALLVCCFISPALFSCSATDEGGKNTQICSDLCAKLELCDSGTDESDCAEDCEGDIAFSEAYWVSLHTCIDETSCNKMTTDRIVDCVGDEISSYHHCTEAGQAACEYMASRLEGCNEGIDEDTIIVNCKDAVAAYFSDSLLSNLMDCFAKSCDKFESCVVRVMDDYDVEDLSGFFFESLGMTDEGGNDQVECTNDWDCQYGEYCDLSDGRCKVDSSEMKCERLEDCGEGWFCNKEKNKCEPDNVCSKYRRIWASGWDEGCSGMDDHCCACRCWNQGHNFFDDDYFYATGHCVCTDDLDYVWDGYPECEGEGREEAQSCVDHPESCKSYYTDQIHDEEVGWCTHSRF